MYLLLQSVMDNLCLAVAQKLNASTKDAFKDAIQTSLVPYMEKAQTQMFNQLNQTYNNGTKECKFYNCSFHFLTLFIFLIHNNVHTTDLKMNRHALTD